MDHIIHVQIEGDDDANDDNDHSNDHDDNYNNNNHEKLDVSSFPLLRIDELSKHDLDTLKRSQGELMTMIMSNSNSNTSSNCDCSSSGSSDDGSGNTSISISHSPLLNYVTRLSSLIEKEIAARRRVEVLLSLSSQLPIHVSASTSANGADIDEHDNNNGGRVPSSTSSRSILVDVPTKEDHDHDDEDDEDDEVPMKVRTMTKSTSRKKKNSNASVGLVGGTTSTSTATPTTTTTTYIAGGSTGGGLRSRAKAIHASIIKANKKMKTVRIQEEDERQITMERNKKERRNQILKRMKERTRMKERNQRTRTRNNRKVKKLQNLARVRDVLRRERKSKHEKDMQTKRDAVMEEMHRVVVDGTIRVPVPVPVRQVVMEGQEEQERKEEEKEKEVMVNVKDHDDHDHHDHVDATVTATVATSSSQRQMHIVAAMAATKVLEGAVGVDLMEESDSGSSLASEVVNVHVSDEESTSCCADINNNDDDNNNNDDDDDDDGDSTTCTNTCMNNNNTEGSHVREDTILSSNVVSSETIIMDDTTRTSRDPELPNIVVVSDESSTMTLASLASGTTRTMCMTKQLHVVETRSGLESMHSIQDDECERQFHNSMLEEEEEEEGETIVVSSPKKKDGSIVKDTDMIHDEVSRIRVRVPSKFNSHENETQVHVHDLKTVEWQPWSSTSPSSRSKPGGYESKETKKYMYTEIFPTFSSIFTACAHDHSMRDISDAGMHRMRECLEYQIKIAASLADLDDVDPIQGSNTLISSRSPITRKMLYRTKSIRPEVSAIISDVLSGDEDICWEDISSENYLGNCWNLLWTWSKPKLNPEHLLICQRISRFQNLSCLTRKDHLKKRIERHYSASHREQSKWNIMPLTFVLPNEYTVFVAAFLSAEKCTKNGESNLWILKPIGSSRGRGISIVKDLGQVSYSSPSVIQQYLMKPLLYCGYKFDFRLYILVTSFTPLKAFIYQEGFARFGSRKFSLSIHDDKNKSHVDQIHLTNSSIQKIYGDNIDQFHPVKIAGVNGGGNKVTLSWLWKRLEGCGVDVALVWTKIKELCVKTLMSVCDEVKNQPNSFEVFGFDVILDEDSRPWLIEVNSCPALARETELDGIVKEALIHDTIKLVNPCQYDREALASICQRRLHQRKKSSSFHKKTSERDELENDLRRIFLNIPLQTCEDDDLISTTRYERLPT